MSHNALARNIGPQKRSVRSLHTAVCAAVVAASAATLVGAGTQAASASEWPWPLGYHHVAVFPTWLTKPTQFCVLNLEKTPGTYAKIRVTPASRTELHDDVYAQPGQTSCISRWWGASPILANNISPTKATVRVWTK